jgi:hypothetical protein
MSHILETYALHCGVKIDKPWIYTQFYPLDEEKYITIQPQSKFRGKQYDYWDEVIEFIQEPLSLAGIKIVQLGVRGDVGLRSCIWSQGSTTVGQLAYLIKGGALHAGVDSIGVHLASLYEKKIVALYSTNWAECCKPYWSEERDVRLLEPDRATKKPSFQWEDTGSQTINEIKPEKIAESILDLLGIEHKIPYETVHIGPSFPTVSLHSIPTSVTNLNNKSVPLVIVRMDIEFNETILAQQLAFGETVIVTNRPLSEALLKASKESIKGVTYMIDENHDVNFVRFLHENGLPYNLMTDFSGSKLKEIKLIYLDYHFVVARSVNEDDAAKIKEIPIDKLVYKTRKKFLKDGACYNSVASLKEGVPLKDVNDFSFCPVVDTQDFWTYLDDCYVAKVLD